MLHVALRCGDGRLVGFQSMEPFAAARARGFEKLFTSIREDNPAALAAYAGQGFRVVGRAERHLRVHGLYVAEIIVERFL